MSEPKPSARFTTSVGSIRRRKRVTLIYRLALAAAALTFALFPVLWVFSASINPTNSLVGQPLIPDNPTWDNYRKLFNDPVNPFPRWYLNSLILAVLVTVVGTAMTTLAAYSFSRFRFGSRRALLQAVLLIQVFPTSSTWCPVLILQQIGARISMFGLNTYGGLLLVYWGSSWGPTLADEATSIPSPRSGRGRHGRRSFAVADLHTCALAACATDPGRGRAADLHLHLFGMCWQGAADRQADVHAGGWLMRWWRTSSRRVGVFSAGVAGLFPTLVLFLFFQRFRSAVWSPARSG